MRTGGRGGKGTVRQRGGGRTNLDRNNGLASMEELCPAGSERTPGDPV